MNITIDLTDEMKRAIRYLGLVERDIRKEVNTQCSDYFENLIRRAKQKYLSAKTMEEIDPKPL